MGFLLPILLIILFIVLISIKQINEYERGILYSFGKFTRILTPGWRLVFPIINSYDKVDIRTKTVDVPEQEAITKDNVSIKINAVYTTKYLMLQKLLLQFKTSILQLVN